MRVAAAARVAFGRDQHMLAERGQMLTTKRTSIRSRLAVRSAAHRPPRSRRQFGHRSIVAPVAATLAATVAVGVGVALARVERERREGAKRRKRERRFALAAEERPGDGLRRIALGQIDTALDALRGARGSPQERVHEARKALKRLRALLRLLEDVLGENAYERESAVVRDAGRRLAQARDAEVLLSTLDALIDRHPKQLGGRRAVRRLRARMKMERDGAAERALADAAGDGMLAELLGLRARCATWELAAIEQIDALEPALSRIYGKGRKRMRRAARAAGKRTSGRRLHEWRKRVKDLRYVAEMLDRANADRRARETAKRKTRKRDRKRAAFVGAVARRADELGELLGEEHDLGVLAEHVRAESRSGAAAPGRRSRKALLKMIARRRKRLRKRAMRDGERLYSSRPKPFVRRIRRATTLTSRD